MISTDTLPLPAPELNLSTLRSKFDREQAAFARLKPQLLHEYRDQYVAIHDEQVVGHGGDLVSVALDAHRRFGHVSIYVDLVTDEPIRPARIPSPRNVVRG